MSRTVSAEYRGRAMWIFDQSLSVWIVRFLEKWSRLDTEQRQGLAELAEKLASVATGANGILLLDSLSDEDAREFVELATDVSAAIRSERQLGVEELRRSHVLGEQEPTVRGRPDQLEAEPVARTGEALAALVRGDLPTPPTDTWWYVGESIEPTTIRMGPGAPPG